MKKLFSLLLIIFSIFTLSFVSIKNTNPSYTLADSGFDSDYDYDYGGGSSWSDSDSDDYYGGDSDDDDYYYSVGGFSGNLSGKELTYVIAFVAITITFIVVINISIKKHRKKVRVHKRIPEYDIPKNTGKDSKVIQTCYNNYVLIQKAWMNRDLAPIKHLLTDEMFNMYQMQLETLTLNGEINVMKDFEFYSGYVTNETSKNGKETIEITMCVTCKDYIINENTKKVLQGNKRDKLMYVYELTFVRDTNTKQNQCPSCGATLKNQMSEKCSYCGNNLLLSSSEYTLSNKKIYRQYKV